MISLGAINFGGHLCISTPFFFFFNNQCLSSLFVPYTLLQDAINKNNIEVYL